MGQRPHGRRALLEGLDGEGQYLDGRSAEAKRFSFVVEADLLLGETKEDWRVSNRRLRLTGFEEVSTRPWWKKLNRSSLTTARLPRDRL